MSRIEVLKTYKIYIDGQFPRTESGRFYPLLNKEKKLIANICLGSRKDFRNAIAAARDAFGSWSQKTAFNRSQILYRIAEMLETRKEQFTAEIILQGSSPSQAKLEVETSIDRIIYYAGWADKFQQVVSAVNPVASSHFNFTVAEPTGVVALLPDDKFSLLSLVSILIPIIASGNTAVLLATESKPLCGVTFAEVINSSDVPAGVVNIITGKRKEVLSHIIKHMDVNAVVSCNDESSDKKLIKETASVNLKRVSNYNKNWMDENSQDLYFITDTMEYKTTWHPIEVIDTSASGY
jgi:acyl-CoA reductase-like NAD-dependent aldehyde dehydrogenase